jgi:DNA-binding NarL/FixJ family response regulator
VISVRPRTVLLADPQPLSRAGLKTVLSKAGLEVIAEASNADGAVAAAERHQPGVCVVDANLPGGSILVVRRITDRVPDTLVVVIAPVVAPEGLLAAVRAGASGYLPKTASGKGLIRAVEAVLSGQAAIPRAAVANLIHEFRGGGRQQTSVGGLPVSLTAREAQVLELLRDGLTTQQIARELGVSPVTVRRHLGAIAAKAGKRGRTDLLRFVDVP